MRVMRSPLTVFRDYRNKKKHLQHMVTLLVMSGVLRQMAIIQRFG